MRRLITAKTKDEWITAKTLMLDLKIKPGTTHKTVKRLLDENWIARKKMIPTRGRWFYVYQATDIGQVRHELGGLPRGVGKVSKQEVDVLVRKVSEVLDISRIKYEDRQVVVSLDPYIAGVLRSQCPKPRSKRDRAEQQTHAEASYVITITNTGIATIRIRNPMNWHIDFTAWMQKTGLSQATAQIILKQVYAQLPGGITRAEVPVLEQAIKRLEVKCHVETNVGGKFAVESNINYSMNEIGLEYFGTTRWVDALIRTLVSLQHSGVVMWVSQDQFIEDIWRAIETQRKEQEEKLELEKIKKGRPDYVI